MDFTSQMPSEVFWTLKCDSCDKCLSHFPIYLSKGKQNICGRCILEPNPEEYTRNEVYEVAAQFFKFPCRFKNDGCHENLFPTDVPNHELNCSFRTVKCPTSKCGWKGPLPNVLHHCQDVHHDLMLKEGVIQFDLNISNELEHLLEHESLLFIIKQKFCSVNKLVEFSISNFEHHKKYSCDINFKKGTRIVAIPHSTSDSDGVKEEIFLESLKNREDSSSTVIEKINFEDAVNKETSNVPTVDEELLSELKCTHCGEYCLPPIYCVGDNPSEGLVCCEKCRISQQSGQTLEFRPKGTFTFAPSSSGFGSSTNEKLNHAPSPISTSIFSPQDSRNFYNTQKVTRPKTITDPSSFSSQSCFAAPSIFAAVPTNSTTNTSIFGSTANGVSTNSSASLNTFKTFRNLAAEKIANHLNYPCRYRKNGCTFISKPPQIKQHLEFCSYGTHFCPLNQFVDCKWQGMGRDTNAHIQNGHNEMILQSSEISTNVSNDLSKCYVIKFSNAFFCLNFEKKCNLFKWGVQIMGPFQNQFMFEVEIVDAYKGLMSKRPCSTLKKKNNLFDDEIFFYKDQLQKFIVDNMLTFKIQVYKQPFQRLL